VQEKNKSKDQLLKELNTLRRENTELSLKKQNKSLNELKKSEKRLHFLFEFAPDAYYLNDLQGNFLEGNQAAADLLGYSKDELLGKSFLKHKILPSKQIPKAVSALANNALGKSTGPEEFLLNRKDGSQISLEISTQPVKINGETVVLGLARDISHRKQFEEDKERHRGFLENLVKERTANLLATNTKLQREIREREHREHALRESEERYKELVEKAGIAILIDDEQGNFQYFNKRFAEFFGYSVNEMKSKNILNLIHADDVERVVKSHKKRYMGLESESLYEFRGIKKDGSTLYLLVHASGIRENGKITGTRSFIWDRTKSILAEAAQKKSEQKYRELYNNMRDAAAVFNMNGKIIEFNPVFEEMIGYESDEIAELNYRDITPQKWHNLEDGIIKKHVLKNGYSEVYQKEFIKKDGTILPVELRTYLIHGQDGNLDGMWAIIRDITERKQIEKEMKMFVHAVKSVRECISVTDLNDNILFVNEAFQKTYGYKEKELLGKNISIIRSKNVTQEVAKQILPETLNGGWDGEILNKHKNGKEFPVYLSTSIIHDDNNEPIALIGVAADITERRKIEDQLRQAQKMDAVGKLAGGIAHDFNNILSVINGYSDMALREIDTANPLHRKLKQIYIAGEKAGNLVRQLLAFSRKQIIEVKVVNINNLITDLDKILIRLIGEDIETIVFLDDDVGLIKADPSQLEQVFVNLIVNARDAINQKTDIASEKKIIVETQNVYLDNKFTAQHRGSSLGAHIQISVTDTGVGMDESTKEKIFEPFFTTKGEGKGTGLGLSTVYGIVKQNDGSIYVESKPGEGTTFNIYWPFSDSDEIPVVIEKTEAKIEGGKESILIVEDEPQVRDVASEALESIGYKIFEASNGIEAMTMLQNKEFKFDLVITDVIMPGMGGKELAENIHKMKPDLKVLFTSGYTDHTIEKSGKLLNGIDFIHKPYSIYDLSQKVRELIEQ